MREASIANQDPGQRPTTTDQLLAEVLQPSEVYGDHGLRVEELAHAYGDTAAARPKAEGQGEAEYVQQSVQSYSPRLQRVIGSVLSWDREEASGAASPREEVAKIFEFDTLIRAAAGQPVVVMKPGKSWLDVGMLEKPHPTRNVTGLQVPDASSEGITAVQLPLYGTATIDLRTGGEPSWAAKQADEELSRRNLRQEDAPAEQLPRPNINPLHAHLILGPEDAKDVAVNSSTAYVLVGYPLLQRAMNRVLGFDPGKLSDEAAAEKYSTAVQAKQRLVQAGVRLDFDFIDGFLAYRPKLFDEEIAETGPLRVVSSPYQGFVRSMLHKKYTFLVEAGWISPVTPAQD